MKPTPQATPAHTPIGNLHSWLWPDAIIGKRGSRLMRDEHNALVNEATKIIADRDALLAALEEMVVCLEDEPSDATARLPMLRAAIAAARGGAR